MLKNFHITIGIILSILALNLYAKGVSFVSTSMSSGGQNSGNRQYSSKMMSSSVSMVMNGNQKYVKSEHEEVYKDKNGVGPAQVRAYKDAFEKKNNDPGVFMRHANTNVETEKKILGDKPEVTLIDDILDDLDDRLMITQHYSTNDDFGSYGNYLRERIQSQFE